jgi:hypothetical protein
MASNSANVRYHGLDGLRACMMLLGIYLHAAVAYSFAGGWPYKDDRSLVSTFHISLGLIHAFRMPVFMFMAGFFGALLYVKRGLGGYARNRIKRVLLPFAAGWLVLFPTVSALSLYGRFWRDPDTWQRMWGFVASGRLWRMIHPMHLWFLEYLVLFYAIAALLGPLVSPAKGKVAHRWFRWAVSSPLRPLWFAIPTYFPLIMMRGGGLDDPSGFMPELRSRRRGDSTRALVREGLAGAAHRGLLRPRRLSRRDRLVPRVRAGRPLPAVRQHSQHEDALFVGCFLFPLPRAHARVDRFPAASGARRVGA